jgi:V/A-type H+-transporting ATPase subunit I
MLLFGFMFGDVGQGLVIFLVGIFLKFTKVESLKKLKPLSSLFQYLGISSMIFGFIYGSIFCYEHVEFIFTPINRLFFRIDKPYLLNIDLKSGDINIAIKLVLITMAIGLIMNLLGILLNILNSFFHKKVKEVLFSRNGIAGFIFLLSIVIMYFLATLFKISIPKYLLYVLLFSALLVVIKDPLNNIIFNKRPVFHDGFGIWILYAIVELLELIMITISNNLSFIRVAAFAVTHGLLSFIFLKIASILGNFGFIIVIIGNIIIIGLEGLVVSIQTIRLEYYEFFSKFFMQKGKKFIPFKIEKKI